MAAPREQLGCECSKCTSRHSSGDTHENAANHAASANPQDRVCLSSVSSSNNMISHAEQKGPELRACTLAGPLSSPLGTGVTGSLRYVLAPYDYNGTIPDGYNHTAVMDSNTVPIACLITVPSALDSLANCQVPLRSALSCVLLSPTAPPTASCMLRSTPALTCTAVSLMDWRWKSFWELDIVAFRACLLLIQRLTFTQGPMSRKCSAEDDSL